VRLLHNTAKLNPEDRVRPIAGGTAAWQSIAELPTDVRQTNSRTVIFNFRTLLRQLLGRTSPASSQASRRIPPAAFHEDALRECLQQLDQTRPEKVVSLGSRLATECISYGAARRHVASEVLGSHPDAAWLLSTDADGRVREAAVRSLAVPPATTSRFVLLVLRLNDWVPQVREAAVEAAANLLPRTPPGIIADAASYVLRQRILWARWGADERAILNLTYERADVTAALDSILMTGRTGALGTTLRNALRAPSMDGQLLRLALGAYLPSVRAVALQSLLKGRATWTTGYDWRWLDKTYGVWRRVPRLEGRQLVTTAPPQDLIRRGIADRSGLVRRVAASALIAHAGEMPDAADLAHALTSDPSRAVRDRAEFLLRHLAAQASPKP
jgi:hypothetical protein